MKREIEAQAFEIAAEHVAWMIRSGFSAKEAKRMLGFQNEALGWFPVLRAVRQRWLSLHIEGDDQ